MELENILIEKKEHVAILTINHPPANAWNMATMQDFEKALENVEDDSEVRVVIITGSGEKCFSQKAKSISIKNFRSILSQNTRIMMHLEVIECILS